MKFEEPVKIEQIGKNRERLLSLEKEKKYVFHGSPEDIDTLRPRQSFDFNKETGKMEKDGEPSIFASPYADIAIFRALINRKNTNEESKSEFGINEDALCFAATPNLIEAVKDNRAYVYVLDKNKFQDSGNMQCRSSKPIKPIEVVEVTIDDLPQNIKIIDK